MHVSTALRPDEVMERLRTFAAHFDNVDRSFGTWAGDSPCSLQVISDRTFTLHIRTWRREASVLWIGRVQPEGTGAKVFLIARADRSELWLVAPWVFLVIGVTGGSAIFNTSIPWSQRFSPFIVVAIWVVGYVISFPVSVERQKSFIRELLTEWLT